MKTAKTTKTSKKPKAPSSPKKSPHHLDKSLIRRVGNHPQLAAWWGRISGEIHWVQDELQCGSGPFENFDRDLANELVDLLDRAWTALASKGPFGPPAEFGEARALAPNQPRAMTVEQLKAAVRAYADENLPGWACSGLSFRLGDIGASVTESLVVLPDAIRKQEANS